MNKICKDCGINYNESYYYCPKCGNELEMLGIEALLERVDRGYKNVYGVWQVTTEGDCEGRSTNRLGIYNGYIDEIALMLADSAYYSLTFEPVIPREVTNRVTKKDYVDVRFGSTSGLRDMTSDEKLAVLSEIFKERNVNISDTNTYGCFKISKKKSK